MHDVALGDEHEQEAEAIDRLLDRAQAAAPEAFPLVEELLRRLGALYAAGLERTIRAARSAGADEDALARHLAADALVSSLLLVHGLHPTPLRERVEAALAAVASGGPGAELVSIDEGGAVTLRLRGAPPDPAAAARLRAEVEAAAPEVSAVRLQGAAVALPVIP